MSHYERSNGPLLLPDSLPSAENISFLDTSFFVSGHKLPTPAEVRHAGLSPSTTNRPRPVSFPSMNLIVKYGSTIKISEGQCLWAIRRLCPNVPVPELFGWCRDKGETFIYMQKIEAPTLEQEWPNLEPDEKLEVCKQLRSIINELRQLQQDPFDQFIGCINKQPVEDVFFSGSKLKGSFPDVISFHNWFSGIEMPQLDTSNPDPWRPGLLDDAPIVFTHNDLHRSNILMTWENGMPRVAAIVDWHQSGWYPASWEYYKTRLVAKQGEQWELSWVLEFLEAFTGFVSWDYYLLKRGR